MDKKYRLGHLEIDAEHREIEKTLSSFIENFPTDEATQYQDVLYLVKLLILHFEHEVAIMKRSEYPDTLPHMIKHNQLLVEWSEVLRDPSVARLQVIYDDLIHHIDGFDRQFIKFVNGTEEKE